MLVYQRVILLVSYELSTMSPYSLRFRNPWKLSWSQVLRKVHFFLKPEVETMARLTLYSIGDLQNS